MCVADRDVEVGRVEGQAEVELVDGEAGQRDGVELLRELRDLEHAGLEVRL